MKTQIGLAFIPFLILCGCRTGTINVMEPAKPETLEAIKTKDAEAPVKVQVVNFVVTSAENNSANMDSETLKRHLALRVPNALWAGLGARRAFAEVSRLAQAQPQAADFVVSGDYACSIEFKKGFSKHSANFKGTMHVTVVDTKSGAQVWDKTYIEERKDEAPGGVATRVQWLQPAHVSEVTSDIKKSIYTHLGK